MQSDSLLARGEDPGWGSGVLVPAPKKNPEKHQGGSMERKSYLGRGMF